MILTYPGEKLEEHIEGVLMAWNSFSTRYSPILECRLKALLGEPPLSADKTMHAILILHDVGKCIQFYQEYLQKGGSLKGYRHEVVSAYVVYEYFSKSNMPEDYNILVTLSVLLHHEAILFNRLERAKLHSLSGCVKDMVFKDDETEILTEAQDIINSFIKKDVGLRYELPRIIKRKEVIECIERFIGNIQGFFGDFMHKLRISYTPFLMMLKLCDYEVSSKRRGVKFDSL